MNESPLISVLIPAYNHGRYIRSTVFSVLAQDWSRMELLIVDDGSTDDTWGVIERLRRELEDSGKFERLELVHQANQGTCMTLNRLMGMARGDFVAMIASDDEYLPGAFSAMMSPMMTDESVGLVVGQNELMDGEGRTCYWDEHRKIVYAEKHATYRTFNEFLRVCAGIAERSPEFGSYSELVRDNHVANGFIVRKSFVDRIMPYRKEAPLEDWWFHLQLSKICSYRAIPEHTFRYRWHAQNQVKQLDRMCEMAYRTRKWEADCVSRPENARWREAFMRGVNTKRVEFRLGRLLELAWVSDLDTRRRILKVFGQSLTLQTRSKRPI